MNKTKICPYCKSIIDQNAVFCVKCKKMLPKKKNPVVLVIIGVILFYIAIGIVLYSIGSETSDVGTVEEQQETVQKHENTEEKKEPQNGSEVKKESEKIDNVEKETEEKAEKQKEEKPKELTESEYKSLCKELYYDDVFFGDDNLKGKYVKLHLMLSEKFYFTADAMYSDTWLNYAKKYSLDRDFYKCCVLRENQNSYVGKQITMWFSGNNGIDPNSYDIGNKVTVYAEVISWSNNTMDGFNSVVIIPKYIE